MGMTGAHVLISANCHTRISGYPQTENQSKQNKQQLKENKHV